MNDVLCIEAEFNAFLKQIRPYGPMRIPLVEYDTQLFLEPSINRRILGGIYRQQVQNWLPGGYVWRRKIYCCHPFEIVLTDFDMQPGELQHLKEEKGCPCIIKWSEFDFQATNFYRGDWINYLDKRPISGDQIELFAAIFGLNRKMASRELVASLKIDCLEVDNLFFQKPHGMSQIRALYEGSKPKMLDKFRLQVERSYCFKNTNDSVRGWGQKVSWGDKKYIACVTPWRSKKNPKDWSWMLFGFEKPYPFYGLDLLEQYPDAKVVLTEDIDAAYEFNGRRELNPKAISLSWLGGAEAVVGLDWKCFVDRKVDYLVTEDVVGHKTALLVSEAVKDAGGTIKKWICSKSSSGKDKRIISDGLIAKTAVSYWESDANKCVEKDRKKIGAGCRRDKTAPELGGRWFGEGLDDDTPEKPFLLNPFIRTGELVIISAPKKTSKSFLAQDISLALASGKGFGEKFIAPKVGRVTYLDAEMGADTIQGRDKLFAGLYGVPKGKVLYTISTTKLGRNINLTQQEDRQWLEREIPKGTKLLVLDNLGKLMAAYGDGNQKQWRVIEAWLRGLNQRMGIILITHTTKTGTFVRGTGKILDDADTVISLRRPEEWAHEDGNIFEFHFEASRALHDEQLEPFCVKYSTKHGRLHREIKGVGEPFENVPIMLMLGLDEKDFTPLEVEMLHLAYKQGEIRAKDFISKEGYPSATAVTDAFKSLLEKELLQRKGKRGNTRYLLAISLD